MHPYRGWPFLSDPHHPDLSAVWAVFAHGVLGVLVILPILLRSRNRTLLTLLAFVGGSVLDLDHVVAAGSLDPRKLEDLGRRPDPHSLLFILALALLAWALTRRKTFAWCVFAVNAGHLLFDAAGEGVYWLFPLTRPDGIPWLACPVGIAALSGISAIVARAGKRTVDPSTALARSASGVREASSSG
jgi:LexA-binding, inner membrane-associated putative hydrolase